MPSAPLRGAVLLAALLLVPACSALQLEHVRALRDLQGDFSAVAARENRLSSRVLLPGVEVGSSTLSSGLAPNAQDLDLDEATAFHAAYERVRLGLDALLGRAADPLAADGLLATALALDVFAAWRAAFYGHVRQVLSGAAEVEPAPPPLTAVKEKAEAALARLDALSGAEGGVPFPRDRFLLDALASGALIRFDVAFIRAVKGKRDEKLLDEAGAPTEDAVAIIEQMARAEDELVAVPASDPLLEPYRAQARLIMLRSATLLAFDVGLAPDEAGAPRMPLLVRRMGALAGDARREGSPLAQNLARLGLDLDHVFPSRELWERAAGRSPP